MLRHAVDGVQQAAAVLLAQFDRHGQFTGGQAGHKRRRRTRLTAELAHDAQRHEVGQKGAQRQRQYQPGGQARRGVGGDGVAVRARAVGHGQVDVHQVLQRVGDRVQQRTRLAAQQLQRQAVVLAIAGVAARQAHDVQAGGTVERPGVVKTLQRNALFGGQHGLAVALQLGRYRVIQPVHVFRHRVAHVVVGLGDVAVQAAAVRHGQGAGDAAVLHRLHLVDVDIVEQRIDGAHGLVAEVTFQQQQQQQQAKRQLQLAAHLGLLEPVHADLRGRVGRALICDHNPDPSGTAPWGSCDCA